MPRRLAGIYTNCIYRKWAVYKELFTTGRHQRHSEFCDACIVISVFNEILPKGSHQPAKGDSKDCNQDVDKFPAVLRGWLWQKDA